MMWPVLIAGAVALLTSCEAPAVVTVNTTLDGGDANPTDGVCEMTVGAGNCSLRAAVDQANTTVGPVTITVPSGTYTLAAGGIDDTNAAGDLDLTGPHAVTINAAAPGARIDAGGNESAVDISAGQVQMHRVAFTNAADAGVTVQGGNLQLRQSASVDNAGAGITVATDATAIVEHTTLSGNGAAGADVAGGLGVAYSTITSNVGGGLLGPGTIKVGANIIANQVSGADCSGLVSSFGYNADSDGSCGLGATGDASGMNADLGSLSADPVPFHRPAPGSIARDVVPAGPNCDGTLVDQTGAGRPVGPACDRGAIEADFRASPTANADRFVVSPSAGATPLDVLGNDTDPDPGDVVTITELNSAGTAGLVTNNGTDVTYDPNGVFGFLAPGETFDDRFLYTVTDAAGNTSWAVVTVMIGEVAAPGAPTDLLAYNASGAPGAVYLWWNEPWASGTSPIVDHHLEYSDDAGASWTNHGWIGPQAPVEVPGFTGGVTYVFRLAASNDDAGLGPAVQSTNTVTIPATAAPDAPANVTVTASSSPRWLDVSWDAPDSHGGTIAYYSLEVSLDGGANFTPQDTITSGTSSTTCCWDTGETIQFRVRATNTVGAGAFGASAPYAVFAGAPTNVSASPSPTPTYVDLSWTAPASTWPVTYYGIESSSDGGSSWSAPIYPGGTETSTSLCCFTVGQSMQWRVSAVTGAGSGPPSTSSNVVAFVVDAPTAVSASPSSTPGSVDLSWTAPAASTWPVTDYAIESSSDGGSSWAAETSTGSASTTATVCCYPVASSLQWRVTATTEVGSSVPSDPSTTLSLHADAPTDVVAALNPSPQVVDLSWTAPTSSSWPVTGYSVETSWDGVNWFVWASTGPSVTSASVCCTSVGLAQQWRVTAVTGAGSSAPSDPSNAIQVYVDAATNVTAAAGAEPGSVDLTWTSPSSSWPVTDYFIELSSDGGANWSFFAYAGGPTPATTLSGLAPGSYQVRLWSMTDAGWGGTPSDAALFTIP